jgi:hypothetical protein
VTVPDQPQTTCSHTAEPCRTLVGMSVAELCAGLRPIVVPPVGLPADVLMQPINPDLCALLAVGAATDDTGTRDVLVVPRHTLHLWGLADADLWEHAIGNLRGETTSEQAFPLASDDRLRVLMGGSWHGAAHILRLAEALDDPLPHGALVTLPSPNAICAVPIRSRTSFDTVRVLIEVTDGLLARDGHRWATDVLWWHHDRLETINAVIDGPDVRMRISDRCKALLDTLN